MVAMLKLAAVEVLEEIAPACYSLEAVMALTREAGAKGVWVGFGTGLVVGIGFTISGIWYAARKQSTETEEEDGEQGKL